jgi:Fic family protein
MIKDERKFLHDISAPISAALITLENLLLDLEEKFPQGLEDGKDIMEALDRATSMIRERRDQLVESDKEEK